VKQEESKPAIISPLPSIGQLAYCPSDAKAASDFALAKQQSQKITSPIQSIGQLGYRESDAIASPDFAATVMGSESHGHDVVAKKTQVI
jgi:hypothetical protein